MTVPVLIFVLVLALQPQSDPSPTEMQQRAHEEYERHKQAAIRINELAQQIHSQDDASALVSEIAAVFAKELPPTWAIENIRQRVADAEYESIRNPPKLVSEQRIVGVWNQYVREIRATDEALVTVAEVHNLRDAEFTASKYLWTRGSQTVWTVPNVYALGSDDKVAEGCRAVEAIRIIYDLDNFHNLRGARDRLRHGIVASDEAKKSLAGPRAQSPSRGFLVARADENPVRDAERRYLHEHGPAAYDQLLKRLFDELFPGE